MYVVLADVPASVAVVAPVVPVADAVIGVAPTGYGSCPAVPMTFVPAGIAAATAVDIASSCDVISRSLAFTLPVPPTLAAVAVVMPVETSQPSAPEPTAKAPEAIAPEATAPDAMEPLESAPEA